MYSTKQTCLSSVRIMYCKERNPLLSTRMEILTDWLRALVVHFSRLNLYLDVNNRHQTLVDEEGGWGGGWENWGGEGKWNHTSIRVPIRLCLLALKHLHHLWVLWIVNLQGQYIHKWSQFVPTLQQDTSTLAPFATFCFIKFTSYD